MTIKARFFSRLYYLILHCFEFTTLITESRYNCSKSRSSTFSQKTTNNHFVFLWHTKGVQLPIPRKIFFKITKNLTTDSDGMNINVAFKVELEDLIRIGKRIFIAVQQAILLCKDTKAWIVDIYFSEFKQFVTLKLKTSYINVNYNGALIVTGKTHK